MKTNSLGVYWKKKNAEMFSNTAENVYESLGQSFMFTILENFPISSGNHPEKEQSKTIENTKFHGNVSEIKGHVYSL